MYVETTRKSVEYYKEMYPPGTRILLVSMGDDPNPLSNHLRGTVDNVDRLGFINVHWDDGRSLSLIPGEDRFRCLTAEEREEEKGSVDELIANAKHACGGSEEKETKDDLQHREKQH